MAPIVDKTERRLASHKRGLLNSRDLIGRKEDHIGNVGRNERRDLGSGKHERLKKGAKVSVCDRLGEMYYFKNECEGFIRFPNMRKQHLKPRGHRLSGFIVFECLET